MKTNKSIGYCILCMNCKYREFFGGNAMFEASIYDNEMIKFADNSYIPRTDADADIARRTMLCAKPGLQRGMRGIKAQ